MCLFGAVPYFVKLDLSVNKMVKIFCTMCNQPMSIIPLAGIDLYKMGRNLDRSDLTEL